MVHLQQKTAIIFYHAGIHQPFLSVVIMAACSPIFPWVTSYSCGNRIRAEAGSGKWSVLVRISVFSARAAATGFYWNAATAPSRLKPFCNEEPMTLHPPTRKPRILVLFSDTGGGHRSAAQAVIEALEEKHPGDFELDMVDVFKAYAPYPLNRAPELYPAMVKIPNLWGLGYRMVDGRRRAVFMMDSLWPWIRPAAKQLVREHPMDLGFSVHPLLSAPVLRALGKHRPPSITGGTALLTAR